MPFHLIRPRTTGRWDLTAAMDAIAPVTSGQFIVEREGDTVWMDFRTLVAEPQGTTHAAWRGLLPVGMRPPASASLNYTDLALPQRTSDDSAGPVRVDIYGGIDVYRHTGPIRGLVAFRTIQPMIASVPGGVRL